MSANKVERSITAWVAILYIFTFALYILFLNKSYTFVIGLTIGTLLSIFKLWLNACNFDNLLKKRKVPNAILIALFNAFLFAIFFSLIFMVLYYYKYIDIFTAAGVLVGVTYAPLVIVVQNVLESLYIIRNKSK